MSRHWGENRLSALGLWEVELKLLQLPLRIAFKLSCISKKTDPALCRTLLAGGCRIYAGYCFFKMRQVSDRISRFKTAIAGSCQHGILSCQAS